jgi:hypothetical protein
MSLNQEVIRPPPSEHRRLSPLPIPGMAACERDLILIMGTANGVLTLTHMKLSEYFHLLCSINWHFLGL